MSLMMRSPLPANQMVSVFEDGKAKPTGQVPINRIAGREITTVGSVRASGKVKVKPIGSSDVFLVTERDIIKKE